MQGGKNWILPKEINANRFFWDSHWLEIWSNNFCPSMGPNGGSVAIDFSIGVRCSNHSFRYRPQSSISHPQTNSVSSDQIRLAL
jgi:hypothetical protein